MAELPDKAARRDLRGGREVTSVPTATRWKQVIGDGLRFHSDEARATEVAIAAQVLNRMLDRPNSVCVA
jgi:hypothetical protein